MRQIGEYLEDLVRIPSTSGDERRAADYVVDACQADGRTIHRIDDSVAVHIPGADPSKAFLLNGHLDTVPETVEWTGDPFALRRDEDDEDKVIGLGVSDMKSGDAIMLAISETLKTEQPPCDVWLLFSSHEETGGAGSKQLAPWLVEQTRGRYQKMGGLVMEPTNAGFVGVGHRAVRRWNVTARGPGGHASQAMDGSKLPPIEKLGRLIAGLPALREEWEAKYSDDKLGAPSIHPTIIHAGQTDNVIPKVAEAVFNLRITPQLVEDLPGYLANVAAQFEVDIEQPGKKPDPSLCQPDEHIYQVAKAALPEAPFLAFPGATDQRVFHKYGIPMLIYGPGEIAAMHQPDEWVYLSKIERCRNVVEHMLRLF